MAKTAFITKNFKDESLETIARVNTIVEEYQAKGFDLTLRQLFYQLVSRGLLDNTQRNYKNLGSVVVDGRMAGLIDWDAITDRGRETVTNTHWEDPAEILDVMEHAYKIDRWANQPNYVRVMVEKQALEGILIPVCKRLDIPFTANKGYGSISLYHDIGMELQEQASNDKAIHILYLGDHDPSGMDMSRDVLERLETFAQTDIEVHRIALNMDQVQRWNPPPNPAKQTDSRFAGYISQFGRRCWELDAINPDDLVALVERIVGELRDDDLWEEAAAEEKKGKRVLKGFAETYREGMDDEYAEDGADEDGEDGADKDEEDDNGDD